jgi:hypothetical protein
MKMDEMGGTRGTYGTQERCIQDFGGRFYGKKSNGNLGIDGRIILIFKNGDGEAGMF